MAQFLLEDVVIVAIDECNFRNDTLTKKQWTFTSKLAFKQIKNNHKLEAFEKFKKQRRSKDQKELREGKAFKDEFQVNQESAKTEN